jgi:hypothetical protein
MIQDKYLASQVDLQGVMCCSPNRGVPSRETSAENFLLLIEMYTLWRDNICHKNSKEIQLAFRHPFAFSITLLILHRER